MNFIILSGTIGPTNFPDMTSLAASSLLQNTIKYYTPEDWYKSWLTTVYNGKGDVMECGSHRGIKLLEYAINILERVLEARLRKQVEINNMQFSFTHGKSTTDLIFILRQLQEKYLSKKREF